MYLGRSSLWWGKKARVSIQGFIVLSLKVDPIFFPFGNKLCYQANPVITFQTLLLMKPV